MINACSKAEMDRDYRWLASAVLGLDTCGVSMSSVISQVHMSLRQHPVIKDWLIVYDDADSEVATNKSPSSIPAFFRRL